MEKINIQYKIPSETQKWFIAFLLATIIGIGSAIYTSIVFSPDVLGTLFGWSVMSAGIASFLFAISFSISSVSYYTNFPNIRSGYQKQIGVLAFWIALFYSITLPILYPDLYWHGFLNRFFTADILLGLFAMTIFGSMVAINSRFIAPYFSWNTIKFVLGLGFFGYGLLAIRAVWIEWEIWAEWFISFDGLPPGRFVLYIIALLVLLLRLSVSIHKQKYKK